MTFSCFTFAYRVLLQLLFCSNTCCFCFHCSLRLFWAFQLISLGSWRNPSSFNSFFYQWCSVFLGTAISVFYLCEVSHACKQLYLCADDAALIQVGVWFSESCFCLSSPKYLDFIDSRCHYHHQASVPHHLQLIGAGMNVSGASWH